MLGPGSSPDPGTAGTTGSGSGDGGPGGTPVTGPFTLGTTEFDPSSALTTANFGSFGSVDWAVPALALTVPGLLLILAVLAQAIAGLVWLPVVRRWLGAFGLRRRTEKAST